MAYRRHQYQQEQIGIDPGWMLLCTILAAVFCLLAFPWIIIGFIAARYLSRWLHWRLSFLFWLVLLFVGAITIYTSYQHGLQLMIQHEFTDYIAAAKHAQTDFLHWPFRQLWAETWPIWLRTFPGIGIAGFCAEVSASTRQDNTTARTLRQNERRRQQYAQRLQRRARKRTSRPTHIPDEARGMMVIGVPINDDNEEA